MAQQPAQQPAWVALQDLPQVSAQPKAPSASAASPAPASTDSSTPAGLAAAASPGAAGSASFGGRGADAVMPALASSGSAGGAAAAHAAAEQPPTPIALASVSSTDSTGSSADGKDGAVSPDPGAAAGLVRIKAQEDSWIEVRQADGVSLHNGLVKGGASIELKGTPPYRLVLGNASHVELSYDGKVQDLKAHTRANNIARLQLR
jgi:cytoskeleton protein RodZ